MSSASAVYHSCRMLVHRCLVSDGRRAVSTVWSTAQPSGQQWEHAETQVSPPRTQMCVRVFIWEPMCKYVVVHIVYLHMLYAYTSLYVCAKPGRYYGPVCVMCLCVCVCIRSLVLIHLHSSCTHSCTHACFPQDGNTSKWKMKEVFLKERSVALRRLQEQEAVR